MREFILEFKLILMFSLKSTCFFSFNFIYYLCCVVCKIYIEILWKLIANKKEGFDFL